MDLKYYENIDLSHAIIVRMKSKDDIREKLLELMIKNKFKRALILSAIGSVYDATFYGVKPNSELPYDERQITKLKKTGPFEVLTMEGNILPMDGQLIPHIHVTLGMYDGNVVGGHLETATVYTTIELILAEIRKSSVIKCKDTVSGGKQIKLPIGEWIIDNLLIDKFKSLIKN